MAGVMHRVTLLTLACCWLASVVAFNLESRIPVVKVGSPHTHFGYSVAQHVSVAATPSGRKTHKSWILVGAPKANNLQPDTTRSGALFKCPLTTRSTDCIQVPTDGYRTNNGTLTRPGEDEIKDGQWMGVTLKSQGVGGKVLVCAHRYINKSPNSQWGFGLCYILSNNLDFSDSLEPCRGKPVNKGHMQYGFCQAGTSGLLLEDEAVLGVPGPFTWRGTVHTSNISDNFLFNDKTQYFGPVTEADSPVNKYSYLGYSVTAGRFFGNNMSYVGGAPRSEGTGQVVFLTRKKIGNALLRVDLTLSGEMFASSFGYEVLAVDINNDKRDDLVVGAPFYHTRKASGAVYIYMNTKEGFKENHRYTKIEGAPGESRFGSSMTSLGDLNRDGYQDVAIGAPYEGRGVIYIFLGSKEGLTVKPAQVIRAEDLPGTPYDAFGYSLSGGMDLDDNGYPDLLTSSFCSDRVVLLRARPIIDIETKVRSHGQLENIDPSKKGCLDDPLSSETCFSFDACFKMDNDAGTRTGLRVHYTIEERLYQDRPLPRVRFDDSTPNQPSEVHRNITLRPDEMGRFQCSKELVYLMEGSSDILRPLRFKLIYEIIQEAPKPVAEGRPLPDINEYPILNQKEALREFEGTFAKECGDDDVCISDLHMTGRIDLEYNEIEEHYLLKLGLEDTVPLLLEVTNQEEPAYGTTLFIEHDEGLIFDPSDSKLGIYQCTSPSTSILKCNLDNPLTNTTGLLRFNFKELGEKFRSKMIHFLVSVNSSSEERTPEPPLKFRVEVMKKAEIFIIGDASPEQVFYGGEVVGESAIKFLHEIGSEVVHKYVVKNNGPSRVDELEVEILWPYQVENGKEKGKWLLYMTDFPTVDGDGECEIDPTYVNYLDLRRTVIVPPEAEYLGGRQTSSTEEPPAPGGDETVSGGTIVIKKNTTTVIKETSTTYKNSSKTFGKEVTESSGGSSSSSSTRFSSSHSGTSYEENVEGSGQEGHDSRVQGRTHSRMSRRVISSSDRSKFNENDLEGQTDKEDEDGRVITHYEKTHHTSGKSPDGRTTFEETRHDSKKVTISENTDNIPSGRWGQGGGYRRVHTENRSSSRTVDGGPEETHWESSQTHSPTEQDGENRWGSSGITERREESWRVHSRTHTDSTTRPTHSGHVDEDAFRRTHEGGAVTATFGGETHWGGDDRRTRTRHQDGGEDRDRFAWSDRRDRTSYDRGTEDRNREGNYYEDRRYSTDDTVAGGRGESQGSDRDEYERRRVTSSSHWSRTRHEDDSLSRTHDSKGSERNYGEGYSGGQGYRNRQDRYDDRRYDDRYDDRRYDDRYDGDRRYDDRHGDTRTYSNNYDRAGGRDDYRGSEGIGSRREWQHRTDEVHGESDGGAGRHRSYSESRTSSWRSHSASGHEDEGRLHRDFDDNYFAHRQPDGSLANGTYTRVEVDPKTGQTKTYSKKVVYNKWSSNADDSRWTGEDSRGLAGEEEDVFSNERSARTKREKELIIKPQAVTDEKTGKTMQVVNLNCDSPATAKCFAFRCNIRNMAKGRTASIRIKSRLWNSTLVEDYPRVSSVVIKSRGSLILPEDIRMDQDQSDDVSWAKTQAYPDLLDQLPPEEVPLWVILVSIFGGLLLLILIVLVLWKLGFFERRRPDPTLSGNLNKDANGY